MTSRRQEIWALGAGQMEMGDAGLVWRFWAAVVVEENLRQSVSGFGALVCVVSDGRTDITTTTTLPNPRAAALQNHHVPGNPELYICLIIYLTLSLALSLNA